MTKRIILFVLVAVVVLVFMVHSDRLTQKMIIGAVLSFVAPPVDLKEHKVFKKTQDKDFPDSFLIGSSSSAYQIEGGWNEGGKSPSIWDDFVHFHPNSVDDNTTGDIGPDSYHNYMEDIRALKLVGHYRLSISWTRIIPNGSAINPNGLAYYAKIIDALIENNIEPKLTMFHWDLPCWLQDLGGLTSDVFVDYFTAYADVLFQNFGDRVKTWMTMNEPYNECTNGYGSAVWAPAIKSPGVGEYLCGHNLLLAHAAAYRLYKEKYFAKQKGSVGIVLDSRYYYAKNSSVSPEDLHRAQLYRLGWFAHPLFSKEGGYPKIMVDEIGKSSKLEGRSFSRLPIMDDETKKLIKGSADFLGINYYTSRLLTVDQSDRNLTDSPAWFKDSKNVISVDRSWKQAESAWLFSVPQGLRHLLNWIKDEYNNPQVFIAENGWSDDGELNDQGRIEYLKSHLHAVSKAINEDGCNIVGYTAWSLLDSFEWTRGYLEKFGLFAVNLTSPKRERTPKQSALYLRDVIKNRKIEL